MTKKIFRSMVFAELIVLILTLSMFSATFKGEFEERSVEEMRIQSGLIEEGILYGGTGLGLSIVKHGVQFLGAELTLSSTAGKGTTVNILFKNKAVL